MNRIAILLIILAVAFFSCSKKEPAIYSNAQYNAFKILNGVWVETNLSPTDYPLKIVFGKQYDSPIPIYNNKAFPPESVLLFEIQGECGWYQWVVQTGVNGPQPIEEGEYWVDECYYYISPNVNYFSLFIESSGNKVWTYKLSIENDRKFTLQDIDYLDRPPYIFIKQ